MKEDEKDRVADPHHFNAEPDPFFYINMDPDPTFHSDEDPASYQSGANLLQFFLRKRALFMPYSRPPLAYHVEGQMNPTFRM
jgi:hypothetical protein